MPGRPKRRGGNETWNGVTPPLYLHDYLELGGVAWHELTSGEKFWIFGKIFEIGQLHNAQGHFVCLDFWKKCHFWKNALFSNCCGARACWRAPQKFYVLARTLIVCFPKKFWGARALARAPIRNFDPPTPLRKKRLRTKIQNIIFLACVRENFQKSGFWEISS